MTAPDDGRIDALVVGGGPAGLGAALWLGRYRRNTLIVDAGEPRNRKAELGHGYLGSDPTVPSDLSRRVLEELGQYSTVTRREGRVDAIRRDGDGFIARVGNSEIRTRAVVLATGVRDELPEIEGVNEHWGADVLHCPACDGFESKGKIVVALGWDPRVAELAHHLATWAKSVTVVIAPDKTQPNDDERAVLDKDGSEVIIGEPCRFIGARGELRCLALADGTEIPCEMVFLAIENLPNADLADQLGCKRDADGCIEIDDEGQTSVPGVYAAGDITPGIQLIQLAAAGGTVAGIGCAHALAL